MITIDLLQGQGVPIKSKPGEVALAAAPFLILAVLALVMVSGYFGNRVRLKLQQKALSNCELKIEEVSLARQFLSDVDAEHRSINDHLREISRAVVSHMQWSDILTAVTESLPESVR